MPAIFQWNRKGDYNYRTEFSNVRLEGGGVAERGILASRISHLLIFRTLITGTTVAALDIAYGWDNDIVESHIAWNSGIGIVVNDGIIDGIQGNNAIRILNTKIVSNSLGIYVSPSRQVQVSGCTIESNAQTGIFVPRGSEGTIIRDNYFEANAKEGIRFDNAGALIHADVVVNGSPSSDQAMGAAAFARGLTVEGNYTFATFAHHFVYLVATKGARIVGNTAWRGRPIFLIGLLDDTRITSLSGLDFRGNQDFSAPLSITPSKFRGVDLSDATGSILPTVNYFSLVWAAGRRCEPGVPAHMVNGEPTERIEGSGDAASCSAVFDLSDFPELAGATVTVSAMCRSESNSARCALWTSLGDEAQSPLLQDGAWHRASLSLTLPVRGRVTVGIRRGAGDTSAPLLFQRLVLTHAGVPVAALYGR
jgi:parallel beta-helix repeat protein